MATETRRDRRIEHTTTGTIVLRPLSRPFLLSYCIQTLPPSSRSRYHQPFLKCTSNVPMTMCYHLVLFLPWLVFRMLLSVPVVLTEGDVGFSVYFVLKCKSVFRYGASFSYL